MYQDPSSHGLFRRSLARGVDTTQASLYAFTKTLGALTGVNALEKFGEDGVRRNLKEIEANPATIGTWDDVHSLSDFGAYVLEAVGEQLPGLGVDVAALATGGGIGGLAARRAALSTVEKAAIGKSIKRQIGEEAYSEFLKKRSAAVAAGQTAGVVAAGTAQNVGETQMSFDQEGIGDQTGDILLAGAVKGALDALPAMHVLGIARKARIAPSDLPNALTGVAKQIGLTSLQEGLTEGAQAFVDQLAVHVNKPGDDLFSSENLVEIRESILKGGLAGGLVGGTVEGVQEFRAYQSHKDQLDAKLNEHVDTVLRSKMDSYARKNQILVPEDAPTVDAQIRAVMDPTSTKDTAYLSPETAIPAALPENIHIVKKPSGTYLTTDLAKAADIELTPDADLESKNGMLLYNRPEPKDATDGTVIVAKDADGFNVSEVLTHPDTFDRDYQTMQGHVPAGGTIQVSDANTVVTDRIQRVLNGLPPKKREEILATIDKGGADANVLRDALRKAADRYQVATDKAVAKEQTPNFFNAPVQEDTKEYPDQRLSMLPPDQLPPDINNDNVGYVSEESATQAMEQLQQDPNVQYSIIPKDNKFFIARADLPQELAPEVAVPTGTTPNYGLAVQPEELAYTYPTREAAAAVFNQLQTENRLPGGYDYQVESTPDGRDEYVVKFAPKQRSVTRIVADAINKATLTGIDRGKIISGKSRKKEGGKRVPYSESERALAKDTVILAKRDGAVVPLTVPDLTSAGMDILAAEKTRDMPESEYKYQALLTMLGRLQERGFDVSDAFNDKGRIRDNLVMFMAGRINSKNPKAVRVKDIQSVKYEGVSEIPTVPVSFNDDQISSDRADNLRVELRQYAESLVKIRKRLLRQLKGKEATTEQAAQLAKIDDNLKKAEQVNFRIITAEANGDPRGIEGEVDTRGLLSESDVDASGASLRQLENERIAAQYKPRPDAPNIVSADSPNIRGWGPSLTKVEMDFANGVLKQVGLLHLGSDVVTTDALDNAVSFGVITPDERSKILADFTDPKLHGAFIPKGQKGIIILRPVRKGDSFATRSDRLLYLGHELGHMVYNSIKYELSPEYFNNIENKDAAKFKRWRELLDKAFVEELDTSASDYSGNKGFDEWFADKVVARALTLTEQPQGIVDRIFYKSAQTLMKVWDKMKATIPRRFLANASFDSVISQMTRDKIFIDRGNIGFGEWEHITIQNPRGMGDLLSKSQTLRFLRQVRKNIGDPAGWPVVRHLFTSEGQLRAMSPELANLVSAPTNTRIKASSGSVPYYNALQRSRDMWNGSLVSLVRKHNPTKEELKSAYDQLAAELPRDKLSPLALDIRNFLGEFHTYLSEAIPNIGKVENYFPREYVLDEIVERNEEWNSILNKHGVNNADGILRAIQDNTIDPLLNEDPNPAIDISLSFDLLASRESKLNKERKLNIPELTADLVKAGFLNNNPIETLMIYTNRSIKRAEFERLFGGYAYPRGYTTIGSLRKKSEERKLQDKKKNEDVVTEYLDKSGIGTRSESFKSRLKLAIDYKYAIYDAKGDLKWRDPNFRLKAELGNYQERRIAELLTDSNLPADVPDNATPAQLKQYAAISRQAIRDTQIVNNLIYNALDLTPIDRRSTTFRVISELKAYEGLRVTLFSGVASIPELGMSFIKNRGVLTISEYSKILTDTFTNPQEAREFSELMGIIRNELAVAVAAEITTTAGIGKGYATALLPYMFRYNGNELLVKYTKMVSTIVAREYLLKLAKDVRMTGGSARTKRYLKELGVTADQITLWDTSGRPYWHSIDRTVPDNERLYDATVAVSNAISSYVHETVLQPTAADRPPFANNIYGSLIFHLKSFAYKFNKSVVLGMEREFEQRLKEDGAWATTISTASWLIPALAIVALFSAISDEIRQRVMSLGEKGTWEASRKDTSKMLDTWLTRSGFDSIPFHEVILEPNMKNAVFDAGPTASHFYSLVTDPPGDQDAAHKVMNSIPVLSQLPQAREMVYNSIENG